MRALLMAGVSACLLWMGHKTGGSNVSEAGVKEETQIAHMVYFTLKDNWKKVRVFDSVVITEK